MSNVDHRFIRTALALMRMALALLDRAGCTLAAARLQHAIDAAEEGANSEPMPTHPATPTGAEEGWRGHPFNTAKGEGTGS